MKHSKKQLYFTFDTEPFWTNIPSRYPRSHWDSYKDGSDYWTNIFIDFCEENNFSATFFIVGRWAQINPTTVRRISNNRNFEIGSHSFWHEDMSLMSNANFVDDIRNSKEILQDITSTSVVRFRAPSFKISYDQYKLLEDVGYKIDSSMSAATRIHGTRFKNVETNLDIIPFEGLQCLGKNLTVLGGGYLRLIPVRILTSLLDLKIGNMIYLHPHDLPDEMEGFSNFTYSENFRKKVRFNNMLEKIRLISTKFEFNAL